MESLWDLIRSLTAFGPHKAVESLWDLIRSLTAFGPKTVVESFCDLIRSLTAFGPQKVVESIWRPHEVPQYSIPLKADHHWHTNETPFDCVSLACRWWPNIEYWLGIFRGSGLVLLKKKTLYFCDYSGEDTDPLSRPLDSPMSVQAS